MTNTECYTSSSLMKEIMKYDFAADELVLFLDTHPGDLKALEMHEAVVCKLRNLKMLYNNRFGPLTSDDAAGCECWSWIKSPWPWDV